MPRVRMTRTVRFALWALEAYLVVLMALIVLRFLQLFR